MEKVPDKPRDVALNQIKLKFIDQERLASVRERFSVRPVWSKNALTALTSIPADRLKLILPAVSYYFTTGPWRNQWIRFGYDPRVEPGAAQHQTLDYRVRLQGGARSQVRCWLGQMVWCGVSSLGKLWFPRHIAALCL